MANPRQPKLDWQAHLPKMVELYKGRFSIPEICDAIQCEGFTPCLSSVYSKFRSEGYPTDQSGRMRFLDATFPTRRRISDVAGNGNLDAVPHESDASQPSQLDPPAVLDDNDYPTPTSITTTNHTIPTLCDLARHPQVQASEATSALGCQSTNLDLSSDVTSEPTISKQKEPELSRYERQKIESEKVVARLTKLGLLNPPKRKGHGLENADRHKRTGSPRPDIPSRGPLSSRPPSLASTSSQSSGTMTRIRSWFKPKSDRPHTRHSVYTEDSGYYSGRATPCPILMETPSPHPESLREFCGLYRVACPTLHQPRHHIPFGDVSSCGVCLFSRIHSLAWSARHLSLIDFRSQLDQSAVYGVRGVDAVGNTALHFVAASGAGYDYVRLLIDYGVDPYQLNTAGQTFLHCLRPYIQEPNLGPFGLDLIKILSLVEPGLAFGQIDNDGRTILHTLASYITNPELRVQTFK